MTDDVFRVTFAVWKRWECDVAAALSKKQMRRAAQFDPEEVGITSPCWMAGAAA